MKPLYHRVAGLDVHRMLLVLTVLVELDDGSLSKHQRSFGSFKRDLRELVAWLQSLAVELVVMESTGVYWKSVYAALEEAGIAAHVVNAHHAKNVPGRKTDIADSEWLAQLGRFGLVRPSFVPPKDLRELRNVTRYRQKLGQACAAEKNRLHKMLDDAGVKLGGVVADIGGASARAMVRGLIDGKPAGELAGLAKGVMRKKAEALELSLEGDLTPRHRLVLQAIEDHIRFLEAGLAKLDAYLVDAMAPYAEYWRLLQTVPGIDQVAAVLILVETGTDLGAFADAKHLASWAGLCPGNHESAGKRKTGKTRKGNHAIRAVMCEVANAARNTRSALHDKYQSLVGRRGHKKAIIAVAHAILRIIYVLFTRREPYLDSGFDYEAAKVSKNAPRWIRALKKFGYWPNPKPIPKLALATAC